MGEELGIQAKKKEFNEWYNEVVRKCGIVDIRYPVKGFPVYMPWAMFIIKRINESLENELEKTGHKPMNFPVVIPEASLKKEKEHVKTFEKEVFWITHAGENKLDERLLLRPTSETAMYPMFSLWIRSHSDLPLKIYQTVQVYRYETKMTKPLLRGREFFWLEAHTAQRTWVDAQNQVREDMRISEKVLSEKFGIPFMLFQRPSWDRFPGAENTYAYDTLIPDGRTLQLATTHNLGQKFSRPFDIKFVDESGESEFAYQTCFGPGVSRFVAAIIAVHGDDKGLVIPPPVAPLQVVIIPIPFKGKEGLVNEKAAEVCEVLRRMGLRADVDSRDHRPGFKFNEWEMKGIPLRIEIGPNDIDKKQVLAVRRDNRQKIEVPEKDLEKIKEILKKEFADMKEKAEKMFKKSIKNADNFSEMEKLLNNGGLIRVNFCAIDATGEKCAERVEKEAKAKVRGVPVGKEEKPEGKCIACGKPAKHVVYIARAY